MARCGCASDQCACHFLAGDGVSISGTGTRSNPYVVTAITSTATEPGGGAGGATTRLSGEIVAYGGADAPSGWLLCDGSLLNRSEFASLFAVIGTSYGAGDGMTTFKLPDLRERLPLGVGADTGRGTTGGVKTQTLTMAHIPSHTHTIDHDHPSVTTSAVGDHSHGAGSYTVSRRSGAGAAAGAAMGTVDINGTVNVDGNSGPAGNHSHTVDVPNFAGSSGAAGSATPTPLDNMPPFQAVNYIIKV